MPAIYWVRAADAGRGLSPASRAPTIISAASQGLEELNDVQTEVLVRELSHIVQSDRYPLSPRIVALKEIRGMMRPEPARPAPLPPRRHYEPPGLIQGRRRRR
jgi:hypothetical protein